MARKLGTRFSSVNLCATLIVTLVSTACVFRPARTVVAVGSAVWPGPLGGVSRTPFLAERVPADPVIQWEERFGRGYTDVPAVHGELIIAGSTAKTITVANATTGNRYWERRQNGAAVGALVRRDDRIYAATQSRDGRVESYSVARGRRAWTFRMRAPAVGGAVLVDSTLYTGSARADLFALEIEHGRELWRVRLPAPLAAAPVPIGTELLVVTTRDSLLRVERATGTLLAGVHLSGSSSAPIAVHGDRVLLPLHPGTLQALRLPDLEPAWAVDVGAPILAAPAIDENGDVYVLTRAADVWRITTAGTATRIAQLGGTAAASLTLTADGLLVGTLDGTARLLRRDGSVVWERSFPHSIRSPIAVRNGLVYVPLGDGRLVMLK